MFQDMAINMAIPLKSMIGTSMVTLPHFGIRTVSFQAGVVVYRVL